jgi:hypothetical protein
MKSLSNAFNVATALALSGWCALVGYPWWPQSARTIVFTIAVALLSALYVYFLIFARHLDEPGTKIRGNFGSLAGVVSLFQSPRVVLAGWIHYLAFDLMVGLFIAADGARIGIAHGWLLPILFLTLMFGPAGLLLYLAVRVAVTSGVWTIEI